MQLVDIRLLCPPPPPFQAYKTGGKVKLDPFFGGVGVSVVNGRITRTLTKFNVSLCFRCVLNVNSYYDKFNINLYTEKLPVSYKLMHVVVVVVVVGGGGGGGGGGVE